MEQFCPLEESPPKLPSKTWGRLFAARYLPQLESYAAMFAAGGLPIRMAVFYVAHGILASLEYNSRSD